MIEFALMTLADARLPTGGHAQSAGLEPALQAGLRPGAVPELIAARLATVVRVDAGAAVLAARAVASTTGPPAGAIADAWAARTPSAVVRTAAIGPGRAIRRLLTQVRPGSPGDRWLAQLPRERTFRPLALGALAAELGLQGRPVAYVLVYDDVQTVTAAALKLLPLDPVESVTWLLQAREQMDAAVDAAGEVACSADIPAGAAPQLDLWHDAHAHETRRLFHA